MKINPAKIIDELLTAITFITDVENSHIVYHSWRVAVIAIDLAQANNLKPQKIKEIYYASLLHDVGSVGLPRHIVHYLETPNKTNYNLLLSHTIIGSQLVWLIPNMENSSKMILDHHEWVNGKGYPKGKKNKEILLGSKIIKTADFIDILLRDPQSQNLKAISKKIAQASGSEISSNLAKDVEKLLSKKGFLSKILDTKNIPEMLFTRKKLIRPLNVRKGIDAIGMTLEVIAQIIDMRHPSTVGHSLRVCRYAMAIALAMELEHDQITRIKWAGLIHDIGKVAISRKIIDKPKKLTKKEFQEVTKHARITEKIIDLIPGLKHITLIAACHHEYFNGNGYPKGLKEQNIPLGARIICICDAFDAMVSNRPYRTPLTPDKACREIQKLAGRQFDPKIVKEAIPILKSLGI